MKKVQFLSLLGAALCVVAGGCHRDVTSSRSAKPAQSSQYEEEGVSYKEGKGLKVPAETAAYIGLRTQEVTDSPVTAAVRFEVQVYQPGLVAHASGFVDRSAVPWLQTTQAVTLTAPEQGKFTGRVAHVKDVLGTNSSRVEVLVLLDDTRRQLTPGTRLTATLATASGPGATAIPSSALLRIAEGDFVYTTSGERFVRTAVKVGVVNPESIEISDGLYAGDQVVVHPVRSLWMAELQAIRGGAACADGH